MKEFIFTKPNHKKFFFILILILLSSSWFFIGNEYEKNALLSFKSQCDREFNNASNSLKLSFNKRLTLINGLEAFALSLIHDSSILNDEDKKSFYIYSSQLNIISNGIINFSIAPNGIQKLVFPESQSNKILGHNLYTDEREDVIDDIKEIFNTKKTVISGPYKLRQEGYAIIARTPILKNNSIWGLVNIVMDFDSIIKDSNTKSQTNNLNISIKNQNHDVFFGTSDNFLNPDYVFQLTYPNGYWLIAAKIKDSSSLNIFRQIYVFKLGLFSTFLLISIIIYSNIENNISLNNKINKMIFYDSLTDLPNRRSLFSKMNSLISNNSSFYVVFSDLDNFKNINDSMGHSIGDQILKEIAILYKDISDYYHFDVYRWGGDEFLFLIEDKNIDIKIIIDDIMSKFKKPIIIDSHKYFLSCSIGLSSYPNDSSNIDELIKNADTAMYKAKNNGKNQFMFYNKNMGNEALMRIHLEKSIREGISNDEFQVFYQPKIDLKTFKIVEVEALIRWLDKGNNNIPPNIFIPIAEESGLIDKLFDIVVSKSLSDIKVLNSNNSNLSVSINLSFSQFNKDLLVYLDKKLKEFDFPPSNLEFEITENIVMQNTNLSLEIISDLQNRNIRVSLDDFGTGYSSLNYLAFLPVNTIKIDKSFIQKVNLDSVERTIVKSLIQLSLDLNINVVAEGVETKDQLEFLISNKCTQVQGYYFSPALPFSLLQEFLKKDLKTMS